MRSRGEAQCFASLAVALAFSLVTATDAFSMHPQCAELPDDPRVPAHLRGGRVWFRHDNDGPEPDPDLNRAEVLRTVCETDRDEWRDLYYDRPGSESDNARDQNKLPNRRAPSLGARSQQIDLICLEMAHHLDAEHAYQTRTAKPGAKAPPPPDIRRAA